MALLLQDEVAAAEPSIDEKTAKLVSKGRWQVPGYKASFQFLFPSGPQLVFRLRVANNPYRRNSATCPCYKHLDRDLVPFVYSSIVDRRDRTGSIEKGPTRLFLQNSAISRHIFNQNLLCRFRFVDSSRNTGFITTFKAVNDKQCSKQSNISRSYPQARQKPLQEHICLLLELWIYSCHFTFYLHQAFRFKGPYCPTNDYRPFLLFNKA